MSNKGLRGMSSVGFLRVARSRGLFALGFVGLAFSASAYTYDTTGYDYLDASDNGQVYSFDGAGNWHSGNPPTPGTKYFIASDKTIHSKSNPATFQGDVFAWAGSMNGGSKLFDFNVLHALDNGVFHGWNGDQNLKADLYVYSDSTTTPFRFLWEYNATWGLNRGLFFHDLKIHSVDAVPNGRLWIGIGESRTNYYGSIDFDGACDASDFTGTLRIFGGNVEKALYDPNMFVSVCDMTFGGTVNVDNHAMLIAKGTGGLVFDKLSFSQGAAVRLPQASTAVIRANDLSFGAGISIDATADRLDSAGLVAVNALSVSDTVTVTGTCVTAGMSTGTATVGVYSRKVLEAPEGSIDGTKFVLTDVGVTCPNVPEMSLSVEEGANGRDTLVARSARPVVFLTANDRFSLTNAADWTDGRFPGGDTTDADYYSMKSMRVGQVAADGSTCHDWMLPGKSFTAAKGTYTGTLSGLIRGRQVNAYEGAAFGSYGGAIVFSFDRLTVWPTATANDYLSLVAYNGVSVSFQKEIEGRGDIWCQQLGASYRNGYVYLGGPNTNYTGKILMATAGTFSSPRTITPTSTNRIEVTVSDARALGGKRSAFTYDALRIRDWALLKLTNSLDFAETTRGTFVDGTGCISVADGCTASFRASFTFGGTLRKQGAGVLALGGTAQFTAETINSPSVGDTPVAGANVLAVEAGAVKPLSKGAFDGVALSFAEGTVLHLDADPADPEVATYGLYDVKCATPVSLADGMSLPVFFDGAVSGGTVTRGVLTVPADQAEALLSRLTVGRRPKGRTVAFRTVPVSQDVTSVVADLAPKGLIILCR